ncbi:hypothetical protein SAMN05216334_11418 [Nitrosomonas ureae]|uniref:Uncharacterized protein n=1 Tax=Nitrosomonas ureae TaxID=44577 RepID=A0A1H5VRS7_9PROT|nr:hypothetical protein SAMN05216334_11418 [Nitrosomonas ureae]
MKIFFKEEIYVYCCEIKQLIQIIHLLKEVTFKLYEINLLRVPCIFPDGKTAEIASLILKIYQPYFLDLTITS